MTPSKDTENIRDLIVRLSRRSRRDLMARLRAARTGLRPLAYNILTLIADRPLTSREAAEEMGINPPPFVSAVDALENKGYLKRSSDPRDRRRLPLLITEKGRLLLNKIPKIAPSDSLARSLARLGAKDIKVLCALLDKLAQ